MCVCGGDEGNGGKSAAEGASKKKKNEHSTVLARIPVGQQCGHAAS